jgi:hypothetical protein
MIKKLLFSIILVLSCGRAQAANLAQDEQQQLFKKLTKKVVRAQVAGKNDQLILDELMREVAAEIDEKSEKVLTQESQKSTYGLVIFQIVFAAAALGFGAWAAYDSFFRIAPADDFVPLINPIDFVPLIHPNDNVD